MINGVQSSSTDNSDQQRLQRLGQEVFSNYYLLKRMVEVSGPHSLLSDRVKQLNRLAFCAATEGERGNVFREVHLGQVAQVNTFLRTRPVAVKLESSEVVIEEARRKRRTRADVNIRMDLRAFIKAKTLKRLKKMPNQIKASVFVQLEELGDAVTQSALGILFENRDLVREIVFDPFVTVQSCPKIKSMIKQVESWINPEQGKYKRIIRVELDVQAQDIYDFLQVDLGGLPNVFVRSLIFGASNPPMAPSGPVIDAFSSMLTTLRELRELIVDVPLRNGASLCVPATVSFLWLKLLAGIAFFEPKSQCTEIYIEELGARACLHVPSRTRRLKVRYSLRAEVIFPPGSECECIRVGCLSHRGMITIPSNVKRVSIGGIVRSGSTIERLSFEADSQCLFLEIDKVGEGQKIKLPKSLKVVKIRELLGEIEIPHENSLEHLEIGGLLYDPSTTYEDCGIRRISIGGYLDDN